MISRLIILFFGFTIQAYSQQVAGGVYPWLPMENDSRELFVGSAHVLDYISMSSVSLRKNYTTTVPANEEHLLLIKSGNLMVEMGDSVYQIGKGSIIMIKPGDSYKIQQAGDQVVQYHLMKYRGKSQISNGFKSFVMDWAQLKVNPHDRGSLRPYFDKPTSMVERFEMHVTTLNEGLMSHQPHTHGAEEIILVLSGETEMLIGDATYRGKRGDVFFVPTKAAHNLKNVGKGQCSYFAFQWN